MQALSGQVPGLSLPSMSAGNTIDDPQGHNLAMAGKGSDSVIPLPDRLDNSPLPVIPGGQIPVSTQPGRYGGVGLPAPPPNQSASVRPEGPQPARDGGWTTGNQPGGNQGAGNPGAGDSGPGELWTASPSFGPARWGPAATNS